MKARLQIVGRVIVVISTITGFAVSFVLLQRSVGPTSPLFGLLGMVELLGLAKVVEPLFLLQMPTVLRVVRPWEKRGVLYSRLLVPSFGRLLRETPLRFLNASVYLAKGHLDLAKVYRQAEAAEAAHFWSALLFTPYIGYVWFLEQYRNAILLLVVQVFVNIYPILHLRMVRGRLDPLLRRHIQRQVHFENTP